MLNFNYNYVFINYQDFILFYLNYYIKLYKILKIIYKILKYLIINIVFE